MLGGQASKIIEGHYLMQKPFVFSFESCGVGLVSIHHIHLLILFPVITKQIETNKI